MKNTIILLLMLWGTFIIPGHAQNLQSADEKPYIEVTGTAEKEIIPDEIYVGITIRERIVNKEKLTIELQEEKLKTALKEIGIDVSKNLSVSDLNADFIRVRLRKKDVYAQKDYTLKVGDAETLGKVFLKLDEVDISDARITRVNHSKLDSIKKSVKIIAVKSAKEKADYLLQAIGEQTGKPLIIRENEAINSIKNINGFASRGNSSAYYVDGMKMIDPPFIKDEIQFQKIKVETTIYVKFGIK